MPKACHTSVKAKTVGEDLFHVIGLDRVEVCVVRTFGDDDDSFPLAKLSVLLRTGHYVETWMLMEYIRSGCSHTFHLPKDPTVAAFRE